MADDKFVIINFSSVEDEVTDVVQSVVARHLDGKAFRASKIKEWVASIGATTVKELREVSENFKYMISTIIMQQGSGAGLTAASSCYFDGTTDGSVTIRWENKAMVCIVTVFGSGI